MSIYIPSFKTIIVDLLMQTDAMTKKFLVNNFNVLADYMAAPLAAASILYIVLTGYFILSGYLTMSAKEYIKVVVTIGLVYMFGLNYMWFSSVFVALFQDAVSHLSTVGIDAFTLPHLTSASGINDALQSVLIEAVEVGGKISDQGSFRNLPPYLVAIYFIYGCTAVVSIAMIEIICFKFFTSLLLAAGPLFISFYLFNATREFFKRWLSLLSGFAFALIFSGFAIGMSLNWMHWVIGDLYINVKANKLGEINWYTPIPLVLVELLSIVVLIGVIPLAKQIGNSSSAIGGFAKAASKVANTAYGTYQAHKNFRKNGFAAGDSGNYPSSSPGRVTQPSSAAATGNILPSVIISAADDHSSPTVKGEKQNG